MDNDTVQILLVEDNPSDLELALLPLEKYKLANSIDMVRDGTDALAFSAPEGRRLWRLISSQEERGIVENDNLGVNSHITKPVDFEQFTETVRQLGMHWLLLNLLPQV